ncbi:mediator of RNA polymerase II transcription subunit 26-like [Littorina saxatilis]|uniref:Mediator of RNA polymerase II transcription subunit 26 n=1 Tax=Littorina saxatilis TaxID=31220 RepID=A0AAN9B9H7_9CAEN
MLPSPVQIKEKLLKALDDKNDVDDATVLEMVSMLEVYPITRATLRETGIGKMVNDLRRKIKNERLAKRVKQLVRNWKKILDQTAAPLNGSPGLMHPAISQLQSSPAVSPALSHSSNVGRLVSPAPVCSKPNTPTLGAHRSASPAVLSKAGAAAGRKGLSPAVSGGRPVTPTAVLAQRVASPALSAGRPRSSLVPTAPGRMVSPALSGHVVSPAVSGRSSRVGSPALASGQPSPLAATSPPVQSPAMRTSTPVAGASGRREEFSRGRRAKGKGAAATDSASCGGRVTPVSLHSETSQDRVLGEKDNGEHDSDNDSFSGGSRAGQSRYPHNHSTDVSFKNSNNKHSGKDQRELSKTNVANRKRTRETSNSPPDEAHKKSRLESSSLSVPSTRQDKVMNGYKSGKKGLSGLDIPRVSSVSSLPAAANKHVSSPSMSSVVNEVHSSLPHSLSESLFRQESTDSRLSSQSLERPSRDKHKVKTTEQLIKGLQKKNNSSNVGNITMDKIRANQIEKESDSLTSALPAGVKPRKRGLRGKNQDINLSVPSSDAMLSQAKSELVERFLQTSDPSSPVDEYSPFKEDLLSDPSRSSLKPKLGLGACSSSYSKDNFDSSFSASRQDRSESAPKDENSMDAASPAVPSTSQSERTGSTLTLQEIYAQLPPIDYGVDWDAVDFYELPEPVPVTEELVGRVHSERLAGVNGVYDINGDWCPWKDMLTLPTHEGNPLHILPYVDLDV